MTVTKGFVVPAGGGRHLDMTSPGRFAALKLLGHETNESIMMFEEVLPAGTTSLFQDHFRDRPQTPGNDDAAKASLTYPGKGVDVSFESAGGFRLKLHGEVGD